MTTGGANGTIHIAVAPVPGADPNLHKTLADALSRGMADAHYLTGRLTVRTLEKPVSPANLSNPVLTRAIRKTTGGATFLVWGSIQTDGDVDWYMVHLYALDPIHQSRQAAGQRPIVPIIHRLPAFNPEQPLATVYAALGVTYMRLNRHQAAAQVFSVVNDFPDLDLAERLPVVFFLALSDLARGIANKDAALIDKALYHFETLRPLLTQSGNPQLIGAAEVNRGFAYQLHPSRKGEATLDLAINAFEAALPHYPASGSAAAVRARILHHIATAEQHHGDINDGVHLHRAIAFYKRALRFWNPEDHPEAYRGALHNMALCYQRLPVGNTRDNLLTAVQLYRSILAIPQLRHRPEIRAATWGNLAQAYQSLPLEKEGRNLWLAVAAYQEALRHWDETRNPAQYGRFNQLIGQLFQLMPAGDPRENRLRAVEHFDKALKVTSRVDDPMRYALIQVKRGVVWAQMPPPGERHSLTLAASAFREALTILTPSNLPIYHTKVIQNLVVVEARLKILGAASTPAPKRF
jgi:tetratricopeptide (TPR) repeat protein